MKLGVDVETLSRCRNLESMLKLGVSGRRVKPQTEWVWFSARTEKRSWMMAVAEQIEAAVTDASEDGSETRRYLLYITEKPFTSK